MKSMGISTNFDNITCQPCLIAKQSKSPSSTYVKIIMWSGKHSPILLLSKVVTIGKELQTVSHCLLCSSSLMLRRRSLISLPATRYQDDFMPTDLLVTSHNHYLICSNKTSSKVKQYRRDTYPMQSSNLASSVRSSSTSACHCQHCNLITTSSTVIVIGQT